MNAIQICMFVTVFSVLSRYFLLAAGRFLPSEALPLFLGTLELSAGCAALTDCALALHWKLCIASVLLSFGGISVLAQSRAAVQEYGLSGKRLLPCKALQAALSCTLTLIAAPLLQWFDANKRLLPFRQEPSAYHIWVSEIMLQQTRVAAAIPYYERFIAALPDPAALAACEPDALRKLWQGLGYYNRVNNMQKAARIVCEQYGGDLPADYDALRSLPGIGDYTAGAVASIAFGIPVPAVDGNVLRVFARLYNDDADVMAPATKKAFTVRVLDQMPKATPGPYNEALMELGALVCIPGTPHCEECPLADLCRGYAAGRADQLPVKPAPKAKGKVPVTVALIESEQGLLLQRRPARGLLAGLWQPAAWEKALTRDELTAALAGIGVQAALDEPLPPAKHVFTHKIWELGGWKGTAPACALPDGYVWAAPEDLAEVYPVPNAFGAYVKAK